MKAFAKTCAGMSLALGAIIAVGAPAQAEPQTAPIGQPDAALVGHYYLSGVMETGSELLLRADGRFDWFISYGAVDQFTAGRWGRQGDRVTLLPDRADPKAALFRPDQRFAWNSEVEARLRQELRDRQADAIAARCPWSNAAVSAAPVMVMDAPASRPGPEVMARATAAGVAAEQARLAAEQAIARAASDTATADQRDAATRAMDAWYAATADMEQRYREAGLDRPTPASPALPAACQLPPDPATGNLAPADWQRGVGVLVGDPARELRLSRVAVSFHYTDGHREAAVTRSGWAFAPRRAGQAVDSITLALPDAGSDDADEPESGAPVAMGQPVELAIAPVAEGVQTVIVDTGQLVAPPFAELHLQVTGDALVPEAPGLARGRYRRP